MTIAQVARFNREYHILARRLSTSGRKEYTIADFMEIAAHNIRGFVLDAAFKRAMRSIMFKMGIKLIIGKERVQLLPLIPVAPEK